MTPSYSTDHSVDVAIFGGGVAGLWLLNRLRDSGYQAVLFEAGGLGGAQTLASQGIIHGGLKYALAGSISGAANAIAAMPQRWRDCLNGEGELDLRGVKVLSDNYYMWSSAGFRSKLKGFLGSKAVRGRVEEVAKDDYPAPFFEARDRGTLYRLPDFVVETESLLEKLRSRHSESILQVDPAQTRIDCQNDTAHLRLGFAGAQLQLNAGRVVFAAGGGNEDLLKAAGVSSIKTQRRPLNMLYLRDASLPPVYVHCIGSDFSMNPKMTVTSHRDGNGVPVWYLGGEIAESGVGMPEAEQIARGKAMLAELLPWVDTTAAEWHAFEIDRAEPAMNNALRPDDAVVSSAGPISVAWPTKLTLSPSLANKILAELPAPAAAGLPPEPGLPRAHQAKARWEE